MNKSLRDIKNRNSRRQSGMTYVELIVVLSIFAAMSSVVLFNYGDFQAKVDIKNLASDIALKVVEAQKAALSGKWNAGATNPNWKPAYGLYFDLNATTRINYFADLNSDGGCTNDGSLSCNPPYIVSGEVQEIVNITKGNYISGVSAVARTGQPACPSITAFSVSFTRPNSGALIGTVPACAAINYAQINVRSPKGATANIKVYSSGRIQVN